MEPIVRKIGNATVHVGDCLESLRTMPDQSVNCCVTSPPYWGLRDYGTARWEGGDAECDHLARPLASTKSTLKGYTGPTVKLAVGGMPYRSQCGKCGAVRIDNQLGLESTPESYVEKMVEVFREVRSRVVLDKVKRHDNQILNLATHLREVIDGNAKLKVADDFTEEHGGIELFTRSKAFDERILDTWEATRREAGDAEPDFSGSRVLAWRNQAVGGYNDLVREMLYGRREARDNPLMVGERVVVCNPVLSLQDDGVTLMHTDEEGFIEKISIRPHPKYPEIECFALVVLRESNGEPCEIGRAHV